MVDFSQPLDLSTRCQSKDHIGPFGQQKNIITKQPCDTLAQDCLLEHGCSNKHCINHNLVNNHKCGLKYDHNNCINTQKNSVVCDSNDKIRQQQTAALTTSALYSGGVDDYLEHRPTDVVDDNSNDSAQATSSLTHSKNDVNKAQETASVQESVQKNDVDGITHEKSTNGCSDMFTSQQDRLLGNKSDFVSDQTVSSTTDTDQKDVKPLRQQVTYCNQSSHGSCDDDSNNSINNNIPIESPNCEIKLSGSRNCTSGLDDSPDADVCSNSSSPHEWSRFGDQAENSRDSSTLHKDAQLYRLLTTKRTELLRNNDWTSRPEEQFTTSWDAFKNSDSIHTTTLDAEEYYSTYRQPSFSQSKLSPTAGNGSKSSSNLFRKRRLERITSFLQHDNFDENQQLFQNCSQTDEATTNDVTTLLAEPVNYSLITSKRPRTDSINTSKKNVGYKYGPRKHAQSKSQSSKDRSWQQQEKQINKHQIPVNYQLTEPRIRLQENNISALLSDPDEIHNTETVTVDFSNRKECKNVKQNMRSAIEEGRAIPSQPPPLLPIYMLKASWHSSHTPQFTASQQQSPVHSKHRTKEKQTSLHYQQVQQNLHAEKPHEQFTLDRRIQHLPSIVNQRSFDDRLMNAQSMNSGLSLKAVVEQPGKSEYRQGSDRDRVGSSVHVSKFRGENSLQKVIGTGNTAVDYYAKRVYQSRRKCQCVNTGDSPILRAVLEDCMDSTELLNLPLQKTNTSQKDSLERMFKKNRFNFSHDHKMNRLESLRDVENSMFHLPEYKIRGKKGRSEPIIYKPTYNLHVESKTCGELSPDYLQSQLDNKMHPSLQQKLETTSKEPRLGSLYHPEDESVKSQLYNDVHSMYNTQWRKIRPPNYKIPKSEQPYFQHLLNRHKRRNSLKQREGSTSNNIEAKPYFPSDQPRIGSTMRHDDIFESLLFNEQKFVCKSKFYPSKKSKAAITSSVVNGASCFVPYTKRIMQVDESSQIVKRRHKKLCKQFVEIESDKGELPSIRYLKPLAHGVGSYCHRRPGANTLNPALYQNCNLAEKWNHDTSTMKEQLNLCRAPPFLPI